MTVQRIIGALLSVGRLVVPFVCSAALVGTIAAFLIPADGNLSHRRIDALRFAALFDSGIREGSSAPYALLLVYTRYNCAQCDQLAADVAELLRRYPEHLAVSWHLVARQSAVAETDLVGAAHCAAAHGDFRKYDVAARRLATRSRSLTWSQVLDSAHLASSSQVRKCMALRSASIRPLTESQEHEPEEYPLLFINAIRLASDAPMRSLDSAIVAALRN